MKYYMTKGERAFEIMFHGNQVSYINEVKPIEKLGDLKEYDEWDYEKKIRAKILVDILCDR